MQNVKDLMKDILENGTEVRDRTGVGTFSVFGRVLRWDLSKGFPAVTSKRLAWTPVVGELLWFIEGSTNINRLRELTWGSDSDKSTIWDDNYFNQALALGYKGGELGPVYGKQYRNFGGVDQLQELIENLKKDLRTGIRSRRHVVSAWNVPELNDMALMPCHTHYQLMINDNRLSLMYSMRSNDIFLGAPFNIASYALLTHIIASILGIGVGELIFSGGDCHVYLNHVEQVNEMLSNECFDLPTLKMPSITSLDDLKNYTVKDFVLENYQSHKTIKAPMAV